MVSTGCGSLDRMLGGGLPFGEVCLVYGEAEVGKTCLAMQCAVNAARMGYKAIFIDSDSTFSARRLSQIAYGDLDEVAPQIILVKPKIFEEQALAIDRLDEYLTKSVGLVAVDTVTSLYRSEIGEQQATFTLNRELGRQMASLAQISKTHKVAVLVNSQVHNVFLEGVVSTEPVATRVLKFWADVVLSLKPTGQRNTLRAVLEKHPKRRQGVSCYLTIEEGGVCDYNR